EARNRSASCLQHRVCVEGSIHHVRATRSRAYCATRSGWKEYLLAEDPGASHGYRRSDSKSTRAGFSGEPFFQMLRSTRTGCAFAIFPRSQGLHLRLSWTSFSLCIDQRLWVDATLMLNA